MVYLFYGQDRFSIREALSAMKDEVGPAELRDVNVTTFDGSDVSLAELTATCNTVPFLAEKRLVAVEGLLSRFETAPPSRGRARPPSERGADVGEWESLTEYLPNVPETTDLVFMDGALRSTNPLLARIGPLVTVRTFPLPRAGELRQWIHARAADGGADIEPEAVRLLAETVGADLQTLDQEIQKLATFRAGEPVLKRDVEELVSYSREANIFTMVDAVIEGRTGVAVRVTHELLDAGRPAAYLLVMIARQTRLLLLAKDLKANGVPSAEMGRRLRLSGFPLRKTLEQEGRLTAERLVDMHRKLLEADLAMKSGAVAENTALDTLIADVSSEVGASTFRT